MGESYMRTRGGWVHVSLCACVCTRVNAGWFVSWLNCLTFYIDRGERKWVKDRYGDS